MNTNIKKERLKLTPEQLFNIYLECNAPGAPVKTILDRYGLRPWDLVAIRKKVKAAAGTPELIGKPVSHIFVHGHESGKFFASLSTVYRTLKAKNMVEPMRNWQRRASYVSAHSLLDEGFSLLCYDGTQFRIDSGIIVWAIPVMILP